MFDIFNEIGDSLKRNKLRTALTGFSVAWSIFLLIILLSAGNGLKNGVSANFASQSLNTIEIYPWRTSKPYKGYPKNRVIRFDNSDSIFLAHSFLYIDVVSPLYNVGLKTCYYKNTKRDINIDAITNDYLKANMLQNDKGRIINNIDINEYRKVVYMNSKDAEILFGNEDPIGKYIKIGDIEFQVIGTYSSERMRWQTDAYIPYNTATRIFNISNIEKLFCTIEGLNTEEANKKFNENINFRFSLKHEYDPNDEAIWVENQMENYLQTQKIFRSISLFIWIIGLSTLVAGIVGISNIMLITVRERTKEFGIRKTIGAKPKSIMQLIISESLIITTAFGYLGMFLGIVTMEIVNKFIPMDSSGGEFKMPFQNPTVDFKIVLMATAVLIISGVIAGAFPAQRATKIKPIEALRYE